MAAGLRMTRNAAKCLLCGDIIESVHRHDFQRCQCGEVFVDGGLAYRRLGSLTGQFEEMYQFEEVTA